MITVLLVRFPQEKVLILIVTTFLNAKARNRTMKQVDSKTNRMVMIGLYSKRYRWSDVHLIVHFYANINYNILLKKKI